MRGLRSRILLTLQSFLNASPHNPTPSSCLPVLHPRHWRLRASCPPPVPMVAAHVAMTTTSKNLWLGSRASARPAASAPWCSTPRCCAGCTRPSTTAPPCGSCSTGSASSSWSATCQRMRPTGTCSARVYLCRRHHASAVTAVRRW